MRMRRKFSVSNFKKIGHRKLKHPLAVLKIQGQKIILKFSGGKREKLAWCGAIKYTDI